MENILQNLVPKWINFFFYWKSHIYKHNKISNELLLKMQYI